MKKKLKVLIACEYSGRLDSTNERDGMKTNLNLIGGTPYYCPKHGHTANPCSCKQKKKQFPKNIIIVAGNPLNLKVLRAKMADDFKERNW